MRHAATGLVLLLAAGCDRSPGEPGPAGAAPFVVDADWLRRYRDEVVVVDLQKTAEDFRKAHFAGARYLDVEELRDDDKLLADAGTLCAILGRLGIDADTHVVAYDNRKGYNAGLLWYALWQLGHREISLLDGQVDALAASDLASGSPPAPRTLTYVARSEPIGVVDSAWVVDHLEDGYFLDARVPEQFTGEKPKKGIAPGHLPGAVNLPWDRFLRRDGTYVDGAGLAQATSGLPRDRDIVLYCNTYQAAASVHFQLARAGFTRIIAFDGSIKLYQRDKTRPLER
jgi:thiosulfate/3-mercaptopyruvate sulfurtransferase